MSHNPSIQALQSPKARNLLRGIIGNQDRKKIIATLTKIRNSCSEDEFRIALEVMRSSLIFKGNPLGAEFNRDFHKPLKSRTVYDLIKIKDRIEIHKNKLIKLSETTKNIYEALEKFDIENSLLFCNKLIKLEGASVFLMKILNFIRNRVEDAKLLLFIEQMLSNIKSENIDNLSLVIRELSSSKTDYFNICDKINNSDDGCAIRIAKSFIDHIPRGKVEFERTLDAYYEISLFDAYLYLYSMARLNLPFLDLDFDKELLGSFTALTKFKLPILKYYPREDEFIGHDYFREVFLVIETDQAFHYKTLICTTYNQLENKQARRIPLEKKILTDFYGDLQMSDLTLTRENYAILSTKYKPEIACHFSNSNALVYLLEKRDGEIDGNEMDFVKLMSSTRDVGIICPILYIEHIKRIARTDELKLVTVCLLYIRLRSHEKEHELRNIIQDIVIKRFDSKLPVFLSYVYEISPAVTEYLITTCDETFLSKLFITIKTPNKAIEERANILEWYGNKSDDLTFLERAKNLRIDIQISKAKGTIDDSRIYVDPVKFTQWVNDQVLSRLTILLETLPNQTETGVVALSWEKVKTGLSLYDQIGSLVLKSYEEFCSNKIFGIASYLGRRIRHGTLKGTGFTDIRNISIDPKFFNILQNKDLDNSFEAWVKEYESILEKLRDNYLHINEKSKADGMISKEIRSPIKKVIANHLVNEMIHSFETNKNGMEIPYIITEYCWR